MSLTLKLNTSSVEVIPEDPREPAFEVSLENFSSFLLDELGVGKTSGTDILLPKGVVSVSANIGVATSDLKKVVFVVDGHRGDVNYRGDIYKDCIFPATEFTAILSMRKGETYYSLVRSLVKMVRPDGTRARYPFPNVYPDDSKVCWGNQGIPRMGTLGDLRPITGFFYLFAQSGFNSDLTPHRQDLQDNEEFFEVLSNAEEFPYECC